MRYLIVIATGMLLLTTTSLHAEEHLAAAKIRQYCKACHGVGKGRFIYSDDDRELWDYLLVNQAPHAKKSWAAAIYDVLNWPTQNPPPFDQLMDPPRRDWMPKGKKRLDLAGDTTDGMPTREYILRELRAAGVGE